MCISLSLSIYIYIYTHIFIKFILHTYIFPEPSRSRLRIRGAGDGEDRAHPGGRLRLLSPHTCSDDTPPILMMMMMMMMMMMSTGVSSYSSEARARLRAQPTWSATSRSSPFAGMRLVLPKGPRAAAAAGRGVVAAAPRPRRAALRERGVRQPRRRARLGALQAQAGPRHPPTGSRGI